MGKLCAKGKALQKENLKFIRLLMLTCMQVQFALAKQLRVEKKKPKKKS